MASPYTYAHGFIWGRAGLCLNMREANELREFFSDRVFSARCAGAREEADALARLADGLDTAISQAKALADLEAELWSVKQGATL